jgi:hypothetical protein
LLDKINIDLGENMTYNSNASGDNTPQPEESKMYIGTKVALINESGSLGIIHDRAPIRGVWVVRWYAGKNAGGEQLVQEDALRRA